MHRHCVSDHFFSPKAEAMVIIIVLCYLQFIVQPYNPEGHITFLALSKLEGLANLPVLTFVERTIEQFMDTAGFQLNRCFSKRGMRIAYEYIESWKVEKSPFYKPTWSGLLSVLGVIGFDSLAQNIGKVLTDTSSSVEPLDDCKDPENGMM